VSQNFSIAGVEFDTDEEAEENKQSSSILIANKLIMKTLRKLLPL
jgi:predicted trehalose synthase